MHALDLVLLVLTAIVLIRLHLILGQRTGVQPDEDRVTAPEKPHDPQTEETEAPLVSGVAELRNADPTFSEAHFTEGARKAFERIVYAYINGAKETLKPLLSTKLYKLYADSIDARKRKGLQPELLHFRLRSSVLQDAGVRRGTAWTVVRYDSEQTHVIRDTDGNIVEGDPELVEDLREDWTYERSVSSKSPHWVLTDITPA